MSDESLDPVAELMTTEIGPMVLNRLNVDFEDSMAFVGRVLGGHPRATASEVTTVDRNGVEVVITDPTGRHDRRIDFDAPLDDPANLSKALIGLVFRARLQSGEPGSTSAEREVTEAAGIRTFVTSVVAVENVHPHLRQITLRGGDLETFAPSAPDTFCYVLLPPPGRGELTVDRHFTWEQFAQMPPGEQPVGAYYTVRRWRPDVAEVDLLFVLHGDVGHASRWAAATKPGDPVALWGPRTSYHPPIGIDWILLVADETGLPAVASILEQLPEGFPARVFAEVGSDDERQVLLDSASFDVTWVSRDGASAGTTTVLADAVRSMVWPGGRPYVFGAGESRTMTAVRSYIREEIGLDRESVSLVAYWRHESGPTTAPALD